VAQGLVDRLEPVDVEVHEADVQPAPAGQRHRVPQPVGERTAVGQAGERVGERPADQVVLGPAAVGDVDQRQDDELRRPVVVVHDLVRLDHPQLGAVRAAQAALAVQQQVRVEGALLGGGRQIEVAHRRVVGVGEQVHVPARELLGGAPGQGAHHRVGDEDVAVEFDHRLGDRRTEEQGLEQLTAVGEERVDGSHALPGGVTFGAGGFGRQLGGGEAHQHRVTHRSREVTELDDGESWSPDHTT
jgi:hypothetical protein